MVALSFCVSVLPGGSKSARLMPAPAVFMIRLCSMMLAEVPCSQTAPSVPAAMSPLMTLKVTLSLAAPSLASMALFVALVIVLCVTVLRVVPSNSTAWPMPVKLSATILTFVLLSSEIATLLPSPWNARPDSVTDDAPVTLNEPTTMAVPGRAAMVSPLSAGPSVSFSV